MTIRFQDLMKIRDASNKSNNATNNFRGGKDGKNRQKHSSKRKPSSSFKNMKWAC